MPPKKLPSKLTPQGSGVNPPSTARNYREPVTTPNLPPNEAISPLWTPNSAPTEVFPEWTDPAALPVEHWGTVEEPFDDTLANANLLVPYDVIESKGTITWKRPCQFLPVIVDAPVHATPPPMSDPKTTAKKGAPVAKKGEPEPKKLLPPKHAHVFVPKNERVGGGTTSSSSLSADHHDDVLHIPRDFQRRWSDEQTEALQAWTREEERIEREQQYRERVYMGFEDAIAYIVNERPRDLLADVDFDADDLVDDGEDEDDVHTTDMDVSNATSPWGVMPPSRIEIAPNAIYKPEVPHGEVVHADMASYFRIVEQLYSTGDDNTSVSVASPGPFLWQAIYPQDSTGQPVYNPGGKYSVKLFVFGRWRRVDVDDKLPLDRDGNVVYLSSSMKSEIWPCLLVKALYKVANWLHPNLSKANEDVQTRTNIMFQTLVQIVLALTSWKVSRWEPKVNSILSENGFHQLLRYVPSSEEPEEVELSVESESGEAVIKIPDEPEITKLPEPRVIICFTGVSKVADMIFGEVVLVTDVVGDTGNTTFKVLRQGSPTTISEETNGVSELEFLLIHPIRQHSDIIVREWIPNPEPLVDGIENSVFLPFGNPRVQFVVVTMRDAGADAIVNLVASLTPVQIPVKPDHNLDNMCKSSELMATHLGGDPTGSVILIEELQKKKSSRSSLPAIVTLNSMFSGNICVSPADNGTMVYRVYPQSTLRYGYSLQVESDHLISFQDAPTYWRSLADFHVIESEGAYPVMLPETWNILFKHSFTLVSPTKEDGDNRPISPELRIDLHLSEELLASFTHISIVNDVTGDVKKVGTLCTNVTLPAGSNSAPIAYTLIVDCVTGDFHVREGKWKLTLASEWDFTKSTTHQMKMTRFEGVYEPNKPLLCFRDVIMAPKSSVWTSFQLQLLKDGIVVNELATKLEVFDLATDQNPLLGTISSMGETRLLQLPLVTTAANAQPPVDDKRGYIIQGSIDKSTCIVPSNLQSLRPFRSNSNRPPKEVAASVDENTVSDTPLQGDSDLLRIPSDIKWRLNCWSSEEVKLLEDNTKELQFEAIRASWAEKSADRNTNGAVSRFLYLGKMDEAEARMKQDNMTDEQIAKVRNRFEWIRAIKAKVSARTEQGVSESYLEEVSTREENLLTEEELSENKRLLLERIGAVEADKDQRRVGRALGKGERANALKNMIRSVVDKRAVFLKKQQELKRELAAVQTQSA